LRRVDALWRRILIALPPDLSRRLIAHPELRTRHRTDLNLQWEIGRMCLEA
jgi:hypothetical protein